MRRDWTLDDIDWDKFDPSLIDHEVVPAVKAAALVEFNAIEYVKYLKMVLHDVPELMPIIERWGQEETQHGRALGRWAEMVDPGFDFEAAFVRFRQGYTLPFNSDSSIRGSPAGEMVARCVVESATSSYYSGMRDNTCEPVLKQIAAHIAADEFRHYKMFYEAFLVFQPRERLGLWNRVKVAIERVMEAEDDELAFAFYSANIPQHATAYAPYDRDAFSREYNRRILHFYEWPHIRKGMSMIAKAVGFNPKGTICSGVARLLWWAMRARAKNLRQNRNDIRDPVAA